MSDNRNLTSSTDNFVSLTTIINSMYCKKYNYDFKFYQPYYKDPEVLDVLNCVEFKTNEKRHASWAKLISTMLELNQSDYEYIVYIDSDCIFKRFDISLEDFINNNMKQDLLFVANSPWHHHLPCAGFFIVKNNEQGKTYIRNWYNIEIPEHNILHGWEQCAIHVHVNSFKFDLVHDPYFEESDTQFMRHIGFTENERRAPYFKAFLERMNVDLSKMDELLRDVKKIKYNTELCSYMFV